MWATRWRNMTGNGCRWRFKMHKKLHRFAGLLSFQTNRTLKQDLKENTFNKQKVIAREECQADEVRSSWWTAAIWFLYKERFCRWVLMQVLHVSEFTLLSVFTSYSRFSWCKVVKEVQVSRTFTWWKGCFRKFLLMKLCNSPVVRLSFAIAPGEATLPLINLEETAKL